MRIPHTWLAAATFVGLAAPALGQQRPAEPAATAVRITEHVTIDGVLNEPFWGTIPPITEFIQREPSEGSAVTERTEVRIAYDDKNLYFGFNLFDSEPDKIVKSVLQREGPSQNDDHVMIGLDTYHDGHNAYIFGLNPFGTQEDGIITDEGYPDWNWESVYASGARITRQGWTLEVAIPFSTIRLADVPEPVMGVMFYRQIRRKNEEAMWPAIGRNYRASTSQVSRYARLEGLHDVKVGRNLFIKPYMFVGAQNPGSDASAATALTHNVGADLRYAVTSNATLDLTYNTDFAQAEADNAQLNLTRFSLFFPEKRDFFLERNGLFSFGTSGQAVTFFSRRIGLNQPILGGARYAGKSGPFTMGYLDIQTKDDGGLPAQNFGVARIRADISPRRTVGAIFTNVQGGGARNGAAGADLAFRFFQSSTFTAWASNVWDPRYTSSTAAADANLLLQNDRYNYQFDYLNVGKHFDPGIGYVGRFDLVRYTNSVGFNPRPASGPVRQLHFNAGDTQAFGQDGGKQSTDDYVSASATFPAGDELGVRITNDSDRPAQPFQIASATVPSGTYAYTHSQLYVNTSQSRRTFERFSWEHGGFYGGTKTSYNGGLTVKFIPQIQLSWDNFERDNLSLPGGAFATELHGLNLFLAAGTNLYSNSLLQYDNVSRRFQANIRIRLIYRPGSDLYLVYNTSHKLLNGFDTRAITDDQRAGVIKLTYLIGF